MKRTIAAATLAATIALAAFAGADSARAQSTKWVPGANYRVQESEAEDLLDDVYDHASCIGVPRFGHFGSGSAAEYAVFDCKLWGTYSNASLGRYSCSYRYRAIRGHAPGYFKLRKLSGSCAY
jgi:hypothetical protein